MDPASTLQTTPADSPLQVPALAPRLARRCRERTTPAPIRAAILYCSQSRRATRDPQYWHVPDDTCPNSPRPWLVERREHLDCRAGCSLIRDEMAGLVVEVVEGDGGSGSNARPLNQPAAVAAPRRHVEPRLLLVGYGIAVSLATGDSPPRRAKGNRRRVVGKGRQAS